MLTIVSMIRHFSIRVRMAGAIAMVLGLFGLVAATVGSGGLALKRLNDSFVSHSLTQTGLLNQAMATLDSLRTTEQDLVAAHVMGHRPLVEQHQQRWAQLDARLSSELHALAAAASPAAQGKLRDALDRVSEYKSAAAKAIRSLQSTPQGEPSQSYALISPSVERLIKARDEFALVEQIVRNAALQTQSEISSLAQSLAWTFGAILLIIVVLVVPLTLANSSSITGPITSAEAAVRAIASGDLSQKIVVQGQDEASHMLAALHDMQQSLTRMVGQLQESSGTIRQASLEVASGSGDLSQRTEHSAGNLQRTASSMLELTAAVRQNADSAETAHRLASSATETAQRGGDVVSQVVRTMDDIRSSSQRIADIIGTVDSIAFQTNILALNAAVEAARAGEQGRGFAVVAGEVRALAQRSASAARQIKQLIDNSVERVEDGSRLVKDAGVTMVDIVGRVQNVSAAIQKISTSTREQSQGIEQVNQAINELEKMTQQNTALVEESAAASADLGDEAARLQGVVSRFKLT